MATELLLTQSDMGMQEATVLRWLKREGERVQEGEELVEIEGAKTTEALVAPASGIIARIVVAQGETVRVRSVLCIIAEPGEVVGSAPPAPAAIAQAQPLAAAPPVAVQVEPRARRLAQDTGVDLSRLTGTGPGGRITEADVRQAAKPIASSGERIVPLTGMRGAIARRMLASLQSSAQFTMTTEVDVTALVAMRESAKPRLDATFGDVVIKAVARALADHPYMNAIVDGERIRILPEINIGVAVALEAGLTVPVIRQADRKTLTQIAEESRELVRRARAGELVSGEVAGSTFSVTNLGMYGVDAFTPVLNAPEVGILGVGRIVERLGRQGADVVSKQMMTLSLTIDHRAVDGAPAASFLQTVGRYLQRPDALFGSAAVLGAR